MEADITRERAKYESKLEESSRRKEVDLKTEREKLRIENEEWKQEFLRKQQEQMQQFQSRLKDEAVRDRNKEIQAIIERLGDETHNTEKNIRVQSEKRVKEVEMKWRADVEEYKALLQQWKEKYQGESDMRKMLDENLRVLGRRINELEIELTDK